MSVWIRNLKRTLEDRQVIILHGNVRDKYIDPEGRVFENLTELLAQLSRELPLSFVETLRYDFVSLQRPLAPAGPRGAGGERPGRKGGSEGPPPVGQGLAQRQSPTQLLEEWLRQLRAPDTNRFAVLYYLDKIVAYNTAYGDTEKEALLRLEKLIDNVTPNNRLVLVALRDTMVPVELYTNSPKTYVMPIPMPDKADRIAYLKHRLGEDPPHLELLGDLSDGLFLRDLDNITTALDRARSGGEELGERELRRLVNKYRIGEQEDYWGALQVEQLRAAKKWFVEDEGVQGQDEPIGKVRDALVLARAGLSGVASGTAAKPRGVLFFAGPTGVGKTLVAKKLAKLLFGTEEAFIRIDMSEFKAEHTVSKLIGSPPGYVGYEEGGRLTNSVRERPFSVVLFDEIEKAHPKIMDVFLQLLDEGRLTDSRGQTVFFTETLIIFTSNLGCRETDSRNTAIAEAGNVNSILANTQIGEDKQKELLAEHFQKAVERYFMSEISRPELLNRIGRDIIPFNYILSPEVQRSIASYHLRQSKLEIEDKYRGMQCRVEFDDGIAQWIVDQNSEAIRKLGARCIVNAIRSSVMTTLAYAILEGEERGARGATLRVAVNRKGDRIEARLT